MSALRDNLEQHTYMDEYRKMAARLVPSANDYLDREQVERLLERFGTKVQEAENAMKAWRYLARQNAEEADKHSLRADKLLRENEVLRATIERLEAEMDVLKDSLREAEGAVDDN
jgi:glutamyl/glutaminyl-tRNA synthetase